MPQTITRGFRAMLEEAEQEVESLSVEEARKLFGRDDVTFVDIRDPREREREGKIPWDPLESTCRHASLSIL